MHDDQNQRDSFEQIIDPIAPTPVTVNAHGDGKSPELAEVARQASEASKTQRKVLERIADTLLEPATQRDIEGTLEFPTFESCIADPEFANTLVALDTLVSKYEAGEFQISSLNKDIIRLGALLFYLSGRVNSVEMAALDAENALKAATSRAFLRAKNVAIDEDTRISDEVAKALALVASDPLRAKLAHKKVVAHTCKGFYYAGAQLLKMMDEVAGRADRERRQPGQV
jgi:hypothetical protein